MSSEKWTPEPWGYEHGDWHRATDHIIRSKETEDVSVRMKGSDIYDAKVAINFSRIVACVNALSGIPDPAAWVAKAKLAIEWCEAEMELMHFPPVRETEQHRREFGGAMRRCMDAKAAYRAMCEGEAP